MKKILIALDFGSGAETIAKTGFELAKAMNAKLLLLYVVTEPFDYDFPMAIAEMENVRTATKYRNRSALEEKAKTFLSSIAAKLGDQNISVLVCEGEKAETIMATGQREKADLIVMGSHRFRNSGRPSISYTASDVFTNSKIPLLAVPILN